MLIAAAAALSASVVSAEIPANYYNSINGLTDAQIKSALASMLYNHTEVNYQGLPTQFRQTDLRPGTNYWWDMYSNMNVDCYITFGTYMNREHAFPKSWWGGLTNVPAYTDLNHLYPAEAKANQAKSNYPLGEVITPLPSGTFDNDVVLVGFAKTGQGGGAAKVFEPADEYKGDFARTYFYMVTTYQSLTWDSKYMYMLQQNDYPTLKPWAIDLLLKWHEQDPVSQKELDRNEAVYRIQNNRNPFIDYPELAQYIWGDKMGIKFYADEGGVTGDPVLTSPVQDMALDFGKVALGKSATSILYFKGENLRGSLSVDLFGTDRKMFSIPTGSISASAVNTGEGFAMQVTYTPTAVGNHTAKISISDGGLVGSIGVQLIGEAAEAPTLTAVTALPASNITSTTYTANWEPAAETVDYYIVSRTRYTNGTSSTDDLLAEGTSLEMTGFDLSDSESYNVRSVALGYESPRSEEIFVKHTGIESVDCDAEIPCGWANYPGGVRIMTASTLRSVMVYDLSGRLKMTIPSVANNDIIPLPYGVYFITAPGLTTPMRVIVEP